MELYKFRPLGNCKHLKRIIDIINNGFYCCDFLNFNDMNEGVFRINDNNTEINLQEKITYKICSFSGKQALKSELMWGHYANAGMGVVIEIDVKDAEEINRIKRVTYENSKDKLNNIEEILTRKSKEWKYENEFRYLYQDENNKVKIGKIKKIYFGTPYKKLSNYEEIEENHEKLRCYLNLKSILKNFCKEKGIGCQDYEFSAKD